MTSREVVQFGMISKIHISAAKTNSAMTLCCTAVRASIPKNEVGTAHRKMVMASTRGRNTNIFTFSLPFSAVIILILNISLLTGRKFT